MSFVCLLGPKLQRRAKFGSLNLIAHPYLHLGPSHCLRLASNKFSLSGPSFGQTLRATHSLKVTLLASLESASSPPPDSFPVHLAPQVVPLSDPSLWLPRANSPPDSSSSAGPKLAQREQEAPQPQASSTQTGLLANFNYCARCHCVALRRVGPASAAKLHSAHCTLHTAHCTLHTAHCVR